MADPLHVTKVADERVIEIAAMPAELEELKAQFEVTRVPGRGLTCRESNRDPSPGRSDYVGLRMLANYLFDRAKMPKPVVVIALADYVTVSFSRGQRADWIGSLTASPRTAYLTFSSRRA